MSDSDDDLLELAGMGSDEESDYEPKAASGRRGLKRTIDDDEESDNDEDVDDEDIEELNPDDDPYPLEGKYKDEADKAALSNMDEVTRESILYERIQEKDKFRERRFLALRAKQSKAESKSIQKGSSSKKLRTSKLSELKRQRERKTNRDDKRRRGGEYDYDEDEHEEDEEEDDDDLRELAGLGEDDEDDEDGYYSDEYESTKKATKSRSGFDQSLYQDATLRDLEKIRSARKLLEKFLYRSEFDRCIPGTYIRVSVGERGQYRMALIEEVKRGGRPYTLAGKPCNTYLKASQGDSKQIINILCLSNDPFTEEEFQRYKNVLEKSDDQRLPTVHDVNEKLNELTSMASRKLTDDDINKMVARKEELSVYSMNTAARVKKLGRLREELQVAIEQGDEKLIKSLQKQIDELSEFFQAHKNTSKLEQINIRNQKSNHEFIRKAEKKLVETKRKQLQNNDFSDPFSRLRTNPKVFYKSVDVVDDAPKTEEKEIDENEEKIKLKNSIFRKEGIDALIKTIDIDLGFNI
ncbi:hypothetical protein C6P40_001433 [Pichia californica]|uniref:Plus3 domain-containing protein n=1 Tax=Pichia californica TaxID=460514 RepID=A0A9P6WJH4_9ASCO|nr:hypothetical protein C6P40_001433 [[Candida] californica]